MELVLRSLCQWEVVTGILVASVRADPNAPTDKELQIERAWELQKERAYTEIDLRIEDQQRVSICDNRNPRLAWQTLPTVYGNRLANTRAALLAEITRVQYDSSGILEHKSKMNALRLKLIEAGHPVPEPLYLNFFINYLPEEFDVVTNTIDFDKDMVDKVVSNLRQIETKRGLCTTTEGSAFAVVKKKFQKSGPTLALHGTAQGMKGKLPMKNVGCSGKCYNCGGKGHWARNCPSQKKKRETGTHEIKKSQPTGDQHRGSSSTTRGLFSAIETTMFLGDSTIMRHCYIDTAASGNFVPYIEDLHDFETFLTLKSFTVTNGNEILSQGMGTVKIKVSENGARCIIDVPHVQWAPDIHSHLFSPGQLIKDGFMVNLHKTGCTVTDSANQILADVCEKGNTYPANFQIIQPNQPFLTVQAITKPSANDLEDCLVNTLSALTTKPKNNVMQWHQHLGHLNVVDV